MPDKNSHARMVWECLRPQESDPAQVKAMLRRLWRHLGRTLAELSVLDRLWPKGRIEIAPMQ